MRLKRGFGLRPRLAGLTTSVGIVACLALGVGVALAVTGAISTTDNPGYQQATGTTTTVVTDTDSSVTTQTTTLYYANQPCLNGQPNHNAPATNCNIYADKRDVWFSGLPVSAALGAGTYFFAVLSPGGQPAPNDGAALRQNGDDPNLSDEFDAHGDRTFSVDADGVISYSGPHGFDPANNEINVFPYANTPNQGGVYILAVCSLGSNGTTYPVNPRDCKYDAFKIRTSEPPADTATALTVAKIATPSWTRPFTWTIGKAVDKTSITQTNGSPTATFNYTVTVTPAKGTDSYGVTGTITVFNENDFDVGGVNVTDAIYPVAPADLLNSTDADANASCSVTGGTAATIPAHSSADFDYSCTYSGAPGGSGTETNVAHVTWPETVSGATTLNAGSADGQAEVDWSAPALSHNCTNVTDTLYGGTLASNVCANADGNLASTDGILVTGATYGTGVTGALKPSGGPYTSLDLKYANTVTAPNVGSCTTVTNTARYTVTDGSSITDTANQSVSVCNYNAGLTIGYWANHLANSARTGSFTDTACGKTLPNGTSCSSNAPWTKRFLSASVCTSPNTCTVGELSDAHATTPITPGYVVDSITKAAAVFAANNCSNASTSDSNAAACLAAQLLGAELNVGNLASPCVCATIHRAIVFLTSVGYKGPGQGVAFNGIYTRAYAITLKTALDNYNNNRGCPSS